MYVQMVWGRARPGSWEGLRQLYVDKVIPMTMGMPGLQGRELWRGTSDPDEMMFWSVWESLRDVRNYEVSEERRELAQEADQYFFPMAYPKGETWIKQFEIISAAGQRNENDAELVMMAWGKLRLGAWDQYEQFFRERVEPTTGQVPGLRERRLLRSTEDPDEGISLSVWAGEEELMDYERGGLRKGFAQDVEGLYRGEFWVKHFRITDTN